MKLMQKTISIAVTAVFALAMFSTSCKRGTTEGTMAFPFESGFPEFDTFDFPTAEFYFYGKFDGKYKLWQDGMRSKWDTATRFDPDPDNETDWSEWPAYNDNIYRNIPEQNYELPCINDSDNVWFEHQTRFLRPGILDNRMEIFFYECIDSLDTIPAYFPFNDAIPTSLSLADYGKALPFTSTEYGRRGVKLIYTDANRDKWTTDDGSGQLIDTYFRLTDFYPRDVTQDTLDTLAMYIIEGEFSGMLYNGARQMPLTEAKFRARLVPRLYP